LKIAIVSEWLDASRGGAETSALQFINQLLPYDLDLHLFTRSRPAIEGRVTVHTVNSRPWPRARGGLAFMRSVDDLLNKEPFDVVHAITPCMHADIYQPRGGTVAESIERNLALRRSGIVRGLKRCANLLNLKQRIDLHIERQLMTNDRTVVVALSQYVIRQLKQHYRSPDERIRLIFNGIELPQRSPADRDANRSAMRKELGLSEQECLFILIAHNFRLKGVPRWMDALRLLVSQGVTGFRSLVIGKGDTPSRRRLGRRMGLDGILTFVGATPRVVEYRDAADVLVHPTYYDPCSRVVMEALAEGLPCLASRWDGAAELISDGVQGFVLDDPSDVPALAAFAMRMLDPTLRRQMRQAAKDIGDRVSMTRHAREMVALYAEIIACKQK